MAQKLTIEQEIAQLLAIAETSAHEGERETARHRAERLMAKHRVTEAAARAAGAAANGQDDKIVESRLVFQGDRYHRGRAFLAMAVARGTGVRALYVTYGSEHRTTVLLYGYASDIARATQLIDSAVRQGEAEMWAWWKGVGKDVTHINRQFIARRTFLIAFGQGAESRMIENERQEVAEAEAVTPGTALVLVDRGKQLDTYMEKVKTSKGRSVSATAAASSAGHAAGRRANLSDGRGAIDG